MSSQIDSEVFAKLFAEESARPKTDHLRIYSSFEEKKNVFDKHYTFESSTLFLHFINFQLPEQLGQRKAVYRGMNEAKFRIFSSAQRAWSENKSISLTDGNLYHQTIIDMIGRAKSANRGLLPKFFKATGMKESDVSILSFLQHYGAPTPLTDWTTNINSALFFATDGITEKDIEHYHQTSFQPGIEHYVSLYILIEDHVLNKIRDFKQLSVTSKKAIEYETLKKKSFQYIDEKLKSGRPAFSLVNNLRVTSQDGLFIYNNSPNLPLEAMFLNKYYLHWLGNNSLGRETPRSPMICIDIHKSIIYWLRKEILQKQGYTKKEIYPKPEDIAKSAVPKNFKK